MNNNITFNLVHLESVSDLPDCAEVWDTDNQRTIYCVQGNYYALAKKQDPVTHVWSYYPAQIVP